jgi:hypothetical protein
MGDDGREEIPKRREGRRGFYLFFGITEISIYPPYIPELVKCKE